MFSLEAQVAFYRGVYPIGTKVWILSPHGRRLTAGQVITAPDCGWSASRIMVVRVRHDGGKGLCRYYPLARIELYNPEPK